MLLLNVEVLYILTPLNISQIPVGKGKESDPTNTSANVWANTLPTRRPTHYQHFGRHAINTSTNTTSWEKEL